VTDPDCAPPLLKEAALHFPVNPTARRLLANERMRPVWDTLMATKTGPEQATDEDERAKAIESFERMKAFQRPEKWGLQTGKISQKEEACLAIFYFAVVELITPRPAWTKTRATEVKEWWKATENFCQVIAAEAPMFDDDFVDAAKAMLSGLKRHEPMLKKGGWLSGQHNPALFVPNKTANDSVRVKARALGQEMIRLYGTVNYGCVAAICNVGLNLSPETEITKQNVADWCKTLAGRMKKSGEKQPGA
jgi:hypothetical protein